MADNTSQIAGLFMTPEAYQQQRDQAALAGFAQQAQLDPFQSAKLSTMYGGYQLGNVLAGALGGQDPMLQALSVRKQVAQNINWNDPQSLANASRQLLQAGDVQGSQQLAAQAQALQDKVLANLKTQSEVSKNMREQKTTDQRNYDAAVEGGYKGTFQQWLEHQKLLGRNVTNINMPAAESEFVKELAKHDAKTVSDAFKTREGAIEELRTLQKMSELNQKPIISGSGAQLRSDVANFFDTLGISSNKDTMKTSNSQEYTKYASGLVLDKIKKLGTNPSNTDRDFANRIVPQLENSPQARTELIQYLAKRANEVVSETNRMEQYARKNKGLSGYEPTIPLVGTQQPSTPYSGLSDAELAARIKRAQAQQRQ